MKTLPTFDANPYKKDSFFAASSIAILFFSLGILSLALGVCGYFVSKFFFFLALYPILFGLALGYCARKIILKTFFQSTSLVILFLAIFGTLSLGLVHGLNYKSFSDAYKVKFSKLDKETQNVIKSIDFDQIHPFIMRFNQDTVRFLVTHARVNQAANSFFAYLEYQLTEGITFNKGGKRNLVKVNRVLSSFYYILELILILSFAFFLALPKTKVPFSNELKKFKIKFSLFRFRAKESQRLAIVTALQSGNLKSLFDAIVETNEEIEIKNEKEKIFALNAYSIESNNEIPVEIELEEINLERGRIKISQRISLVTYPSAVLEHLNTMEKSLADHNSQNAA